MNGQLHIYNTWILWFVSWNMYGNSWQYTWYSSPDYHNFFGALNYRFQVLFSNCMCHQNWYLYSNFMVANSTHRVYFSYKMCSQIIFLPKFLGQFLLDSFKRTSTCPQHDLSLLNGQQDVFLTNVLAGFSVMSAGHVTKHQSFWITVHDWSNFLKYFL